mmetsp:Transcript_13473/g.28244  ORF Transcript_13473/g.28244 Transcript_13473/m.28244 type:complete len:200 (+) Transcript_13473:1735-2334(+)
MANLHFVTIDQHTIQLVDRGICSFGSLVVDVTISFRETIFTIGHDFTGKNVSEKTEGIVQLLVIDRLVEVLDKDVSNSRSTKRWVALTPHDAARLVLDHRKIHRVESAFRITHLVVVHVGVTKRTTGDGITTDTDGGNRSDGVENLEQKAFIGIGDKITNVQRCRMEGCGTFASGSTSLCGHGSGGSLWGRGRGGFSGG